MFVDTSGWAAAFVKRDRHHSQAIALLNAQLATGPVITTNYVLSELTALFLSPLRVPKTKQVQILKDLRNSPTIEVVVIDPILEAAAWRLWETRLDKEWSLVDCASFVVMQQRGLQDALTNDHHFEQAGFTRLLK